MEPLDNETNKIKRTNVTSKWVDMVIASTVGPNLSLFAMTDPNGIELQNDFKRIVTDIIMTGAEVLTRNGPLDVAAFTATSQKIVLERYNQFITQRLQHLLRNPSTQSILVVNSRDVYKKH